MRNKAPFDAAELNSKVLAEATGKLPSIKSIPAQKQKVAQKLLNKDIEELLDDKAPESQQVATDSTVPLLLAQAEIASDVVTGVGAEVGASGGTAAGGAAGATGGAAASSAGFFASLTAGQWGLAALGVGLAGAAAGGGGGGGGAPAASPAAAAGTTAPTAPTLALAADTGASSSDGVTNNGLVNVGGLESGATWQYSVNGGSTWQPGSGNSFMLQAGTYAANNIQVRQSDAAGNVSQTQFFPSQIVVDSVAPTRISTSVNSTNMTVLLTFDGPLDGTVVADDLAGLFTVTTGGQANPITNASVNGATITLQLTNAFAHGAAVTVQYADPTGDTPSAIQDASGNDAVSFTISSGLVADGYVRGAEIWIDTAQGRIPTGQITDANGLFFLPEGMPSGTIVAVGGVNIDTGIPNTMELKAPEGSTVINPLTTLVQAVIDAGGAAETAADLVATSLGVTLPAGESLLSYDPISANDTSMQKVAAQVATTVILSASAGAAVVEALADQILQADQTNSSLDLSDAATLGAVFESAGVTDAEVTSAVADATAAIDSATTIDQISAVQSAVLDDIAPGSPSFGNDTATNDTSPTVRVTLNASATDGTAVVEGDQLSIFDGGVLLGAPITLTASDIATGYVDVTLPTLVQGAHTLTARLLDQANNASAVDTAVLTVDTAAPNTPTFNTVAADGWVGSSEQSAAVSGTVEAGATISLSLGGNVRTVVVGSGGNWSYTLTTADITAMGQGAETLSVTAADAAGNVSAAVTRDITVDTLAPIVSTTINGTVANGGTTNTNTPALSGTLSGALESGDVVAVYDGAARLGFANVSGTSWTFASSGLSNQSHSLSARVIDAAGNLGAASATYTLVVNAGIPTATVSISGAQDDVDGASTLTSGGVTNDAAPSLSGTITGTLAAGDQVVIYRDGVKLGTATVPGSDWAYPASGVTDGAHTFVAVVEASGGNQGVPSSAFALTVDTVAPNALSFALANDVGNPSNDGITNDGTINVTGIESGATWQYSTDGGSSWVDGTGAGFTLANAVLYGSNQIQVRQIDQAGNVSSVAQNSNSILIDISVPATPVITAIAGDNAISGTERTAGVSISGTADVGDKVVLTIAGASPVVWTDGSGNWTYALTDADYVAMGQGSVSLSAKAVDLAGNESASVTANITIDTAAPTLTPFTLATGSDSGVAGDNRSNVTTPTIQFTAGDGSTLEYSLDGTNWTSAGMGTGASQQLAVSGLVEGGNTIQLRATDAAGNVTTRSGSYVLDTTAPALSLALATDSGASGTDWVTDNGTVNIVGLEAGATWQYSTDGGVIWTAGTGTNFTLGGGTHAAGSVRVRQTDTAGNVSTAAQNVSDISVDDAVVAPSIALATDSGASASDGITNIGTVSVSGLEAGATWQYSTDSGTTWTSGTGNSFTLNAGSYAAGTVQVRQTDLAGHVSTAGQNAGTVTVDTATAAPGLALATDSGASTSDGITNVGTVNVSGLEAGATWQFSTDSGGTWASGTGSSFTLNAGIYNAGAVQVRQTDLSGNVSSVAQNIGTFMVDAAAPAAPGVSLLADTGALSADGITSNGTVAVTTEGGSVWQYSVDGGTNWATGTGTSFTLATGSYAANSIQVRQTDMAGNLSPVAQIPATITVDVTAPQAVALALALDSGSSPSDGVTGSGQINVSNLESDAVWHYSIDGGATWVLGAAQSLTLSGGSDYSVLVRQTDLAGNVSVDSTPLAFTLDETDPTATATIDSITDDVDPDVGTIVSGTTTNDNTLALTGSLSGALGNNEALAVYSGATFLGLAQVTGTTWSFTTAGLNNATHSLVVRVEDAAGNVGTASSAFDVTVNATVPTAVASIVSAAGNVGTPTSITNGGLTNDTTLGLSGTLSEVLVGGEVVRVYDGITLLGTADVSGTTWNYTTTALGGGAHNLTVVVASAGGNTGTASAAYFVNIDTTAPDAPTLSYSGSGNQITVSGLEGGASWQYRLDSGGTWLTGSGSSFALSSGSYTADQIQVRQFDAAGNEGATGSYSGSITIVLTSQTLDVWDSHGGMFPITFDDLPSGSMNWFVYDVEVSRYRTAAVTLNGDNGAKELRIVDLETGAILDGRPLLADEFLMRSANNDTIYHIGQLSNGQLDVTDYAYGLTNADAATTLGSTSFTVPINEASGQYVRQYIPGEPAYILTSAYEGQSNVFHLYVESSPGQLTEVALSGGMLSGWMQITPDGSGGVYLHSNLGNWGTPEYQEAFHHLVGQAWTQGNDVDFWDARELEESFYSVIRVGSEAVDLAQVAALPEGTVIEARPDDGDLISLPSGNLLVLAESWQPFQQTVPGSHFFIINGTTGVVEAKQALTGDLAFTVHSTANDGYVYFQELNGLVPGSMSWTQNASTPVSVYKVLLTDLESVVQSLDTTNVPNLSDVAGVTIVRDFSWSNITDVVQTANVVSFVDGIVATASGGQIIVGGTWDNANDQGTTAITAFSAGGTQLWRQSQSAEDDDFYYDDVSDTFYYLIEGGAAYSVVADGTQTEITQQEFYAAQTGLPLAPTFALEFDTGLRATDGITNDGGLIVNGLEAGATWEYSTDGGVTWATGTGNSFTLGAAMYLIGKVQVRQTDLDGNVSPVTQNTAMINVDTTAPATILSYAGTGSVVTVGGASIWDYSLDSGATWQSGGGSSLTLPVGNYAANSIQVWGFDLAGNSSVGTYSAGLITVNAGSPTTVTVFDGNGGSYPITFNDLPLGPTNWWFDNNHSEVSRYRSAAVTLNGDNGARELRIVDLETGEILDSRPLQSNEFLMRTADSDTVFHVGKFSVGQLVVTDYAYGLTDADVTTALGSTVFAVPFNAALGHDIQQYITASEGEPAYLLTRQSNVSHLYAETTPGQMTELTLPTGLLEWTQIVSDGSGGLYLRSDNGVWGTAEFQIAYRHYDGQTWTNASESDYWDAESLATHSNSVVRVGSGVVDLAIAANLPTGAVIEYYPEDGDQIVLPSGNLFVRAEVFYPLQSTVPANHFFIIDDATGAVIAQQALGGNLAFSAWTSVDDGFVYFDQLNGLIPGAASFAQNASTPVTIYKVALSDIEAVVQSMDSTNAQGLGDAALLAAGVVKVQDFSWLDITPVAQTAGKVVYVDGIVLPASGGKIVVGGTWDPAIDSGTTAITAFDINGEQLWRQSQPVGYNDFIYDEAYGGVFYSTESSEGVAPHSYAIDVTNGNQVEINPEIFNLISQNNGSVPAGVDVLGGTTGNDTLTVTDGSIGWVSGGAGSDTLSGADQGDKLLGESGNDILQGNGGNDFLRGGTGGDVMTGGAGNDTFAFGGEIEPAVTIDMAGGVTTLLDNNDTFSCAVFDKITDFSAEDTIALGDQPANWDLYYDQEPDGSAAGTGFATDNNFYFVQGTHTAAGTFTVDTVSGTDTLLVYDSNPAQSLIVQSAIVIAGVTPAQMDAIMGPPTQIIHI